MLTWWTERMWTEIGAKVIKESLAWSWTEAGEKITIMREARQRTSQKISLTMAVNKPQKTDVFSPFLLLPTLSLAVNSRT